MVFVSGVYYPVDTLPAWLAALSSALPHGAAVSLVRPLVLGQWPEQIVMPLALIGFWTVLALVIARALTLRRFAR